MNNILQLFVVYIIITNINIDSNFSNSKTFLKYTIYIPLFDSTPLEGADPSTTEIVVTDSFVISSSSSKSGIRIIKFFFYSGMTLVRVQLI